MGYIDKQKPYFTWGCSDDLTFRLRKTLYCGEDDDCYDASSAALTGAAVSMLRESAKSSRRKLSHRYASSLTRQLSISPCALMMSILYSERLRQLDPCYLDRVSSSDLYVVSMLVATKFLHDEGEKEEIYNDEWAEAAGLAVSTVNRLEREFLDAMDWNIYVNPEEFLAFCSKIETKIAFEYGLKRGWFSYTDLTQCLLAVQYQNVLKDIMEKTVKVIGGCVLVYGMSLSLIMSSIITYTATSQLNPPSNGLSSNSSLTGPVWSKNTYTRNRDYCDRSLTRQRQRRRPIQTTEREDKHQEEMAVGLENEVFERLENATESEFGRIPNSGARTSTCTLDNPPLRFESRFQHKIRQTGISLSFDLKDLQRTFMDGVDWNELTAANDCTNRMENHVKQTKKLHGSLPPYLYGGSKHFMSDTRLLGMPVI